MKREEIASGNVVKVIGKDHAVERFDKVNTQAGYEPTSRLQQWSQFVVQ